MSTKKGRTNVRVIKAQKDITKSDATVQLAEEESYSAGEWLEPPADMRGLSSLVDESSILPQCIRAYRNNIAGFGIGVKYIEDEEESTEGNAEYAKMKEIIECLTMESDTKEVFEDLIEARETYGIAYLEVIRNNIGEVVQVEFMKDTPTIRKTKPLDGYQDMTYYHHGQVLTRKKKFRKYRQQVGGKTVYFKEFGDPRVMDSRDGTYVPENESLDIQYQANELLEYALGSKPYGTVRWIGQVLSIDGARKAEMLNNNYFENGRHTPLAIIVQGGTLTDESFDKLQNYMNDIKGEAGQHAFLILETESTDSRADFDSDSKPTIEMKDLASILQKDELFQEYCDNNRRKVQSSFQLPDLYVGYTTDFNRATAQTAQEVTEEQVFQPQRGSLAWLLNNKLLNGYQFKHVEAYFKTPNITNPDDLVKVMTVANNAGGLTPNKAREILFSLLGETSDDYEGDWGNIPLSLARQMAEPKIDNLQAQLNNGIAKAQANHDDEIVVIMKQVKKLLSEVLEDEISETEKE